MVPTRATLPHILAALLRQIEENEKDHGIQFGLLLQAQAAAYVCGYATGYRFDPDDPEWAVLFIELPTGQVSWEVPEHIKPWDGHSSEEKYARARAFAASLAKRE